MSEQEPKRERLRRERREAEQDERSKRQREKVFKLIGATIVAAVLAIAILIVANQAGGDEVGDVDVVEMMDGIPQQGSDIGDPDAEVTLLEYGDMLCPFCRDFAQDVMPDIIEGPVREGRLKVDFRNWPILGEDSVLAARATFSAGEQGRYWEFLEAFYTEADPEVDMDFLQEVAEAAAIPDLEAWEAGIEDPRWDEEIERVDREASELGLSGTPSFAIQGPDGEVTPIDVPGSLEELEDMIDRDA